MTDIVKVWGTCDKIQIEFTYEGGTAWSCIVPPDFEDGIYVAEFWAIDTLDRIGHWSGFLYMSSGVCHFKFKDEKYQLWFKPQTYNIEFNTLNKKKYQFNFNINEYIFEFSDSKYKIFFKKGCNHWEH